MYKPLYARDPIDRLYASRKEGGIGLASIEDSVNTSIRRLKDYKSKQRKTKHSDKKHKQHKDQQNNNN